MLKGQRSQDNSKVTTKEDKSKELTNSKLNETDVDHSKSDTTLENDKDGKTPRANSPKITKQPP